ncbi:DUF397 domain-containing protein [Streptomyces sp. NPDC006430]|uniref:DUF397 domain-containing protein n=1 Tax=Streptomyces sp. NPDC006430 TaxID=3154299 RepID=UPI0033B23845
MSELSWRKSSYCGTGEACVHVATEPAAVKVAGSADPGDAHLTVTTAAWSVFLRALRQGGA